MPETRRNPSPPVTDVTYAEPRLAELMHSFFRAKTSQDVEATMAHLSESELVYVDATLGLVVDHDQLRGIYTEAMPNWGEGRTYPTRIVGDERSALVFMTCTPELFGGEVLAIVAADLRDGKVVRWVDYWDGRHFGAEALREIEASLPREGDSLPRSFGEERVESVAAPRIEGAATGLARSLAAGDAAGAAAALAPDCVFEDMTLRLQIRGRSAIERFLERSLPDLPYGVGAEVRHVLGGERGGGYEWMRGTEECGVTCLEVDDDGAVVRMTSLWNGARMDDDAFAALAAKGPEPAAAR